MDKPCGNKLCCISTTRSKTKRNSKHLDDCNATILPDGSFFIEERHKKFDLSPRKSLCNLIQHKDYAMIDEMIDNFNSNVHKMEDYLKNHSQELLEIKRELSEL